jgi:transcription antitermination factor NusG
MDLSFAGNTAAIGGALCEVKPTRGGRRSGLVDVAGPGGVRSLGGRPNLYPPDLLSSNISRTFSPSNPVCSDGSDASTSGCWWLAHTLPRQEKALASALYARDVPFYLPLVTRKSLSRGRTRVAQIALFPGYVFIRGDDEDRLHVLQTNRVLTVHRAPDGERLRADLQRFYELISAGAPLLPEARLISGERVRVRSGPFRGQEGVVIRRNGKTRLLIAVDYLQQGASLEVDDCLLERV